MFMLWIELKVWFTRQLHARDIVLFKRKRGGRTFREIQKEETKKTTSYVCAECPGEFSFIQCPEKDRKNFRTEIIELFFIVNLKIDRVETQRALRQIKLCVFYCGSVQHISLEENWFHSTKILPIISQFYILSSKNSSTYCMLRRTPRRILFLVLKSSVSGIQTSLT